MDSFDDFSNNTNGSSIYDPVARIVVIGIGGAGNNAINRMIDDEVKGVEFVGVNTDIQDLRHCRASKKVAIGEKVTGGRGCGALPEVGESAANESKEAIRNIFRESETQKKADMVFITCGMGGGTGTGAAPIVASIAKEEGILTVAVITKPFRFEGKVRMSRALNGIDKLYPNVDTLIMISNDKLLKVVDVKDGFKEAFTKADEVLKQSIKGITDLINLPSLVNLDFADVSTVMKGKGLAHIAIGEASGENRVSQAISKAITSPLLDTSIDGATDLIVSISGEVSLIDVDTAMQEIEPKLNPNVNIIFGAREDKNLNDAVSITLIATGIKDIMNTNANYRAYQQKMNYNQNLMQQNYNPYINFNNNMPINNIDANNINISTNENNKVEQNFAKPEKEKISSLFFNNKKENNDFLRRDTNKIGALGDTNNSDLLNVDLGKLGFAKKNNTKNILPSFITDNNKN